MRAGNRHRLRAAPDFHAYTGSPQCRLLTLYYYKALPGDLQERKSRKCFKKTNEKLNPLHKTKNKTKNRCRTLFFKAAKECLLEGMDAAPLCDPSREKANPAGPQPCRICKIQNNVSAKDAQSNAEGISNRQPCRNRYFFSSFSQASAAPSRYSPP
jgi:hypothetical protein